MCTAHSRHAFAGNPKESLRTPTTLRCRIAVVCANVPLCLESVKGGINRTDRHLAVRAELNFLPNSDSIGVLFEPQQRQDNDVLEFSEVIPVSHYLYNREQIGIDVALALRTVILWQPVARLQRGDPHALENAIERRRPLDESMIKLESSAARRFVRLRGRSVTLSASGENRRIEGWNTLGKPVRGRKCGLAPS
jgi:hypothetical protein